VLQSEISSRVQWKAQERGFSLLEMMAAMTLLLVVSGVVMAALMRMMKIQGTISNRTEMHTSVRSATELLQQEIGQAGRITLPGSVTLTGAVALTGTPVAVSVSSSMGIFAGEQLVVDSGANKETVTVSAVSTNQFTAAFGLTHASGAAVAVMGGFASGIVPTSATNGSTGSLLKLYGDINGDGQMVYIEYYCDTAAGNLYRNTMSFTAASKPARTSAMILLPSILPNPGGTACFTYQEKTVAPDTYVVDVAVTLTVQTQNPDPQTKQFQTETKALLNVSPRNIFEAWQMASGGVSNRIQPMPPSVTSLLP
jgi:prepilin-type N-terminal cleavage/methylation domain-containing protein